ncbi:MAG: GNAT family N-acetyltransferase [Clostridiales bacterium]|nr:GNAT family N-acetyltransferase [Clostridiales bacterium]
MNVELKTASVSDAEELWRMQVEGFASLLEKYQDFDMNPACETVEKTIMRLERVCGTYYFILVDGEKVGAICIREFDDGWKKLGPLFVLPAWRGKGIAQRAIRLAEDIHGVDRWMLDTIAQEPGNCHLYEKLGYRQTGTPRVVNERMTLVDYVKE